MQQLKIQRLQTEIIVRRGIFSMNGTQCKNKTETAGKYEIGE